MLEIILSVRLPRIVEKLVDALLFQRFLSLVNQSLEMQANAKARRDSEGEIHRQTRLVLFEQRLAFIGGGVAA